jgi:hypothetical protein
VLAGEDCRELEAGEPAARIVLAGLQPEALAHSQPEKSVEITDYH